MEKSLFAEINYDNYMYLNECKEKKNVMHLNYVNKKNV